MGTEMIFSTELLRKAERRYQHQKKIVEGLDRKPETASPGTNRNLVVMLERKMELRRRQRQQLIDGSFQG